MSILFSHVYLVLTSATFSHVYLVVAVVVVVVLVDAAVVIVVVVAVVVVVVVGVVVGSFSVPTAPDGYSFKDRRITNITLADAKHKKVLFGETAIPHFSPYIPP